MKLSRSIEAQQLIKSLQKFEYYPTRQHGSHIRLTTQQNGQHHITIPKHDPLRIGTLNTILTEIALHLGISKQELKERLF